MPGKLAIIGAALLLASSGVALACQGSSNPVFDDRFNPPDPGWGAAGTVPGGATIIAFTPQGMTITPPVNATTFPSNPHYTMDGADLCVSVTLPATLPTPANSDTVGDVGIAFWIKDVADIYLATMSPDGNAAIERVIANKRQPIYGPTAAAAIKTAAGSTNEIEIMVSGNKGSFYINGTKITDFSGQPPPNGGPPGVYAESGSTAVTTWLFPRIQLY